MIRIHQVDQGSEEWHQLRAGKYTGSNADKLLKFGAIDYSLTETGKFRGNFWTKRGHILEAEAIEIYEQIRKTSVDRVGFVTNSKWPSAGYSPDGLGVDRTIEVKCFDEAMHMKLFNGNVPFKIQAQIHYGMFLCEKDLSDLIIYNPNLDPKQAFKIIPYKSKRAIKANLRNILNKSSNLVRA